MSTYTLNQTGTAAASGAIQGCSPIAVAATPIALTMSVGGSAGSAQTVVINRMSNSPRSGVMFLSSAAPAAAFWDSGTWTIRLNVTTANANLTWSAVYVCRVTSSYSGVATIGSNTMVLQSLATTGVKSTTVSGSSNTSATGDLILIVLVFANIAASNQSFAFTPDQAIDTPIVVPNVAAITPAIETLTQPEPLPIVIPDIGTNIVSEVPPTIAPSVTLRGVVSRQTTKFYGRALVIAGSAANARVHPDRSSVVTLAGSGSGTFTVTVPRPSTVRSAVNPYWMRIINECSAAVYDIEDDDGNTLETINPGEGCCLTLIDPAGAGTFFAKVTTTVHA